MSNPINSAPPRPSIPRLDQLDLVVVTERLRLRPLEDSDLDDLWPLVSDPELPRLMTWAAHPDRAHTAGYLASTRKALAAGTGVAWGIEVDGRVVGSVGYHGIEFAVAALRVDRAELGYWIAPALRGQGLTTEAAHAAVRCGFETLGLHKVNVRCVAENVASRRVIEKLGFRFVGTLEDDVWRDGRWWSMLSYELVASEWTDVSTTMRVNRPRLP